MKINISKPPIGLKPAPLFYQKRFLEVCQAISRYYNKGLQIPLNWVKEYNELIKLMEK